jgi:hypothetical protein
MADRLVVDETLNGYQVFWLINDEVFGEDTGAVLGQGETHSSIERMRQDLKNGKVKEEDLEHIIATVTVAEIGNPNLGTGGFVWETLAEAKKALTAAKAAYKIAKSNKPWPEWAVRASGAGWKPPKGWKP